jgi:hypothetical protein
MRETDSIAPAWEGRQKSETKALPGTGPAGSALRALAGATRKISPPLYMWLSGKAPEFKVAWGAREYALRFDGVHMLRREGKGWSDNPRSNYNDAVERRQTRGKSKAKS